MYFKMNFICFLLYQWHPQLVNRDIHHRHHVTDQDARPLLAIEVVGKDMIVGPDLPVATKVLQGVTMREVNVDLQEVLMTLDIPAIEAADIMTVDAVDALALAL